MKRLLKATLFAILFQVCSYGQSYYTYGPTREQNWSTQQGGGIGPVGDHLIGVNTGGPVVEYICFVNWQWDYNNIPTEAIIDTIVIKFQAKYQTSTTRDFNFTIHYIESNWTNIDLSYYYTQVKYNDNRKVFNDLVTSNSNGLVLYEKIITSGALFDSIKAAINNGRYFITFALRSEDPESPSWKLSPYGGPIWQTNVPTIDLTIKYKTNPQNYQFVNTIENTENSDSIIVTNMENLTTAKISSGTTLGLTLNTNYSAITNLLPFVINWNSTGLTEKQSNWIANSNNDYSLRYNFVANLNYLSSKLTANFLQTQTATIQINFLDGGINGTVNSTMSFRDPWYYFKDQNNDWQQSDIFKDYTSPLLIQNNSINSYGGVFLDQGWPGWNPPYYSVKVISPQPIILNGRPHNFYFQNWEYDPNKIGLQSSNALETGVVFKDANATLSANMKGTQLSSNENAYSNNGQRKFVRTDDGYLTLHSAYESLGHVFYERSTDNGNTWELWNNGLPIDNSAAKCPSLDVAQINQDVFVVILYQQEFPSQNGYELNAAVFKSLAGDGAFTLLETEVVYWPGSTYSHNTNPVITIDYYGRVMIVWKIEGYGLYYRYGTLSSSGLFLSENHYPIPGTTVASINPTITSSKMSSSTGSAYLAFEENNQIKYCKFTRNPNGTYSVSSIETPSAGGRYNCTKPSIGLYTTQQSPSISWIGQDPVTYQQKAQLRIKYNGTTWSQFWTWGYGGGNDITSVNINNNTQGKFVIGWGGDLNDQYITSYSPTTVYNLTTQGDVQVSNAGTTMGDMKIMSFDRYNTPHDFTPSAVTQGLYKGLGDETVSKGFVLTKNNNTFSFDFGGIKVDETRVLFNDSFEEADSVSTAKGIESESFLLTNTSNFSFKIDYYSPTASSSLPVKFKLKLVDAVTGKVISVLKEQSGVNTQLTNSYYLVNTNGIGNREVKLRLDYEAAGYEPTVFSSIVKDTATLYKENFQLIAFTGSELVTEYGLEQNYPNPFNPTTVINYQIKEGGFVTLKLYDLLGSEVKTFVNEDKTKGRYSYNFNASGLASGVYIYQLKVNDPSSSSGQSFVDSKKLILVK